MLKGTLSNSSSCNSWPYAASGNRQWIMPQFAQRQNRQVQGRRQQTTWRSAATAANTVNQQEDSRAQSDTWRPSADVSSREQSCRSPCQLAACNKRRGPPAAGLRLLSQAACRDALERVVKTGTALLLSALLTVFSGGPGVAPAAALTRPSLDDLSKLQYGRPHRPPSKPASALPDSAEAETLFDLDKDLFTEDAYKGMQRIVEYAKYVESQHHAEQQPDCEECESNRVALEKAWQVVANEFFDAHGTWSQEQWAIRLLQTLQESGGLLHTKHQLYAAAERMMNSLGDEYSEFLPPSRFRQALRRPQPAERDYLAAQMTGVGLAIGTHAREGGWRIAAPLAESPAEEAGILRGERIIQIDDYHVEGTGLTKDEVTALLRGPAGSRVSLVVASADGTPRHVLLERRSLPQPPVKQARLQLADGREVAYIRCNYFASATRRAVQTALFEGEIDGIDGIILDLRNNPGGVFEEAIAIASLLLDDDTPVVATVRTPGGFIDNSYQVGHLSRTVFQNLPGTVSHAPLVVLVNAASASASEVLAGALHDNGRATLVGEQTFGKGVIQYYFPVEGDGGVKLTVAKYLTPHKYDITREGGLRPDVACSDYPHSAPPSAATDKCLALALDILQEEHGIIRGPTLIANTAEPSG